MFRFETKDGSAWKSYTPITTADELKAISNNLDGSYILENDIPLSGDWSPLGMDPGSPFTGCFDGNGYNIKGLNVKEPSGSYQGYGLFGYVTGSVVDVNVEGNVLAMKLNVGGIVGYANGGTEISVCYSSGSVTAESSISGGIVGNLTGNLTDCFSSAEVSGIYNVGGIIGSVNNNPTVTNCIFAGKVKYEDSHHGGISGQEGGSYTNCYYLSGSKYHIYKKDCTFPKLIKMAEAVTVSTEVYNFGIDGIDDYQEFTAIEKVDDLKNIEKDVTGNYVIMADELDASGMKTLCDDNKFAGKLAGNGCKLTLSKPLFEYNSGLVMGIYAAGTIDGSSKYNYGAIARENSGGTIYGCSFSGSLTALDYAGGIVGLTASSTTVSECYNTGSVSGNRSVGGVVGLSESASKISDCLNTGRITGKNDVGGIAYYNDGTIINCWNTGSITGESNASGICCVVNSNAKVTGCYNTGALSAQSTYGISERSGNKIQNSYYLSADPGNDNNAKTAKAFASGEVAYLLNGDQSTIA